MTSTLSAYLEQEILSASPIELVCMLYQAAIMEVRDARRHLAAGNIAARCASVTKACDITGELLTSLDHAHGGEIARNLSNIYRYILGRLLAANLNKADAPLAEVLGLLTTLSEGWQVAVHGNREPAPETRTPSQAHIFGSATAEPVAQSWSF